MITSTNMRVGYNGAGSVGPYSFNFALLDPTDLQVLHTSALGVTTTLVYLADYSMAGVAVGSEEFGGGGSVTLFTPLATGESLDLLRIVPQTQPFSFRNAGPYFAGSHEDALDRITMVLQGMQDAIDRSVKQSETTDPAGTDLSFPAPSALKLLGWNALGTDLANYDSLFMDATVQTFTNGAGFTSGVTTQLVLTYAPGSSANVAIFFDGTLQDHTKWSLATKTITFNSAIVATKVEIQYRRSIDVSLAVGPNMRDVQSYGAVGDGTTDDTVAFQNAINASSTTGIWIIVPAATYIIDSLVIKDRMRLMMSPNAILKHKSGSTAAGMILLPPGVVQDVHISGGQLKGNGNAGKHGIYLNAQPILTDGHVQGGLWYSTFDNVHVQDFLGEQWWLRGTGDFLGPHQFLTFMNCRGLNNLSATKRALRLTGQVGQIEFIGGQFDGPGRATGNVNLLVQRTVNDSDVNNGDLAPYTVNFRGTTFQSCNRIATLERSSDIIFDGAHFEEAQEGIYVDISGINSKVVNCRFANIGHRDNNDGTGWAVKCANGAVIVEGNTFLSTSVPVATDTHYVNTCAPNDYGLRIIGHHYDTTGIRTFGTMPQMGAATATVDIGGFVAVGVNTSATVITTIASKLAAHSVISILASNGPLLFGTGGNLALGQFGSRLLLHQDAQAFFQRVDLGGNIWRLISVSQPLGNLRAAGIFITTTGTVDPSGGSEFVDATGGNKTRTLPVPYSGGAGTRVTIKKYDGSANTVAVVNADGGTWTLVSGNQWVEAEWDGTAWKVVGSGTTSNVAQGTVSLTSTNGGWGGANATEMNNLRDAVNACVNALKRIGLFT